MIAQIIDGKVTRIFSGTMKQVESIVDGLLISTDKLQVGDEIDQNFNPIQISKTQESNNNDEGNDNAYTEQMSLLQSTDWYVLRFVETGEKIPEEIVKIRAEAREKISIIRSV